MLTWKLTGWLLWGATILSGVLFLTFPDIDLWVSALFYDDTNGFIHRENSVFHIIRYALIYSMVLLFIATVFLSIRSLFIAHKRHIPLAIWGYALATFCVGPLLLVNGIFKSFWGRARPAHIEYFGGDKTFSPPLLIADQCEKNCSFVSGEGSALATILILFGILVYPYISQKFRIIGLVTILPIGVIGIALRVVTGRHFFSDTIFAILFCALVAWGLYRVFQIDQHVTKLKKAPPQSNKTINA